MRARRGAVWGWLVVVAYAAALVAVTVTTPDGDLRAGDRGSDASAAEALVEAWERSRTATFLRHATFERRSATTGSVIASEDVLAQRPPRRLHRQLGGIAGRDDRRELLCPAGPDGREPGPCVHGVASGPTYAADVASEVAGVRSMVEGSTPLYAVAFGPDEGCFELAQQRADPRATFGVDAVLCFDPDTGAPADSRVAYAGGIVEVVAVTSIRPDVTDADLEP